MKYSRPLVVAILTLAAIAGIANAGPGAPSVAAGFDWERVTPESQGVDSEVLLRAVERIRDEDLDVRSLILIRNDRVILELYVHPYTRDTVHNVKSVSKSVLSALVGIGLREGALESTDQPVRAFFPAYFPDDPADPKNQITLHHLLTMTAGIDLDENGPKMRGVFRSGDWIRATFEPDMAAAPGERFVYTTPLTHTMVGVLTEASGHTALEFANEHLFGPLAFGALQWTRGPQGYYFGGSELFLRPRDMAKFGMLYAHDGAWAGRQLVPAAWVAESTRNQMPPGCPTQYGYWWWLDPDGGGFRALGWGGQGITVRRDLRLVAARTAGDPTASDRMFRDFDPTALRDEPLPPNPDAVRALDTLVRALEHPAPTAVPPLPAVATEISGRTYLLAPNPRNLETMTFRFEAGVSTATIVTTLPGETLETAVGLDGVYRLTDTGTEGPMPDHNRLAVRGRWTPDAAFVIDSHRVGDPMHAIWTFRFEGNRLNAEVEVLPTGLRLALSGRAP